MNINGIKEQRKRLIAIGDKQHPGGGILRRTIGDTDIESLSWLMGQYKPSVIFEIGTWIGTSAMAMDLASGGAKIYTCDKNNVYVYDGPNVAFYNCDGKAFLRKMIKQGIRADFIFIDASMADDMKYVPMAMKADFIVAVHDFEKGKKGWKNIVALQKLVRVGTVYRVNDNSCVAYAEVRR